MVVEPDGALDESQACWGYREAELGCGVEPGQLFTKLVTLTVPITRWRSPNRWWSRRQGEGAIRSRKHAYRAIGEEAVGANAVHIDVT